ncbi:MAG: hypothetical protein MJ252_17355 [archaeon]|nr:hypothetical protein [archaeon]
MEKLEPVRTLSDSEFTKKESAITKAYTNYEASNSEPFFNKENNSPLKKKRKVMFHNQIDVIYVESYKQYNKETTTIKVIRHRKKNKAHCSCIII